MKLEGKQCPTHVFPSFIALNGRHRLLGNGVSHARTPLVNPNRPSRREEPLEPGGEGREGKERTGAGRTDGRTDRGGEEGLSILSPLAFPFPFFGRGGDGGDSPR